MKKELDELLCAQYPAIFGQRTLPMTETCMCWGFCCGDGWFDLIDRLAASLQDLTRAGYPQVVAVQVKEKFGTLSFYVEGASDEQFKLIWSTGRESGFTCERCGAPGERYLADGWHMTRCSACAPAEAIPARELQRKDLAELNRSQVGTIPWREHAIPVWDVVDEEILAMERLVFWPEMPLDLINQFDLFLRNAQAIRPHETLAAFAADLERFVQDGESRR